MWEFIHHYRRYYTSTVVSTGRLMKRTTDTEWRDWYTIHELIIEQSTKCLRCSPTGDSYPKPKDFNAQRWNRATNHSCPNKKHFSHKLYISAWFNQSLWHGGIETFPVSSGSSTIIRVSGMSFMQVVIVSICWPTVNSWKILHNVQKFHV